ncbi:MAG: phosphoribosyltransferase family protein [bacterium]|nr:phosphoribosyltransferase family protein [bacterium]
MGVKLQKLRDIIFFAIDIVLPRKERTIRAERRTIEELGITPQTHDACGVKITTILDYKNPAVEDCIRALKYDGSSRSAEILAEALADYLREEISQVKSFSPRKILLVPIPLFKTRERERGFNQIEIVLKKLPKEFLDGTLSAFAPRALVRIRETKQQTKLSRAERLKNMTKAFSAPNTEAVQDKHIFLIDDVTTTGATLAEAARPLRKTGAEVTALALARA